MMEIQEIIELIKAVSENGLTQFELEQGDTKLAMKREKKVVQTMVPVAAMAASDSAAQQRAAVFSGSQMAIPQILTGGADGQAGDHKEPAASSSDKIVACPLVGTFYSSPSPDADDFVKVGDSVKKGQVLGIVEAMKLMNEIECEYDGIVDAILVKNEETVEYGQPLFRIR